MASEGQRVGEWIRSLPLEDLVDLHSQLTMAIYEREDTEGLDPGFWPQIQRRIQQINAGTVQGGEAFSTLVKM